MRCSVVGVSPVAASKRRRSWRSEMNSEEAIDATPARWPHVSRRTPSATTGSGAGRVGESLAHGSLQMRRRLLGGAGAGDELLKRIAAVAPELVGIEGEVDEL